MASNETFSGGWPVLIEHNPETGLPVFLLSDGSEVEGEDEAMETQIALPWPRPFRSPVGGWVTSDGYRFATMNGEMDDRIKEKAVAHQERYDAKESV